MEGSEGEDKKKGKKVKKIQMSTGSQGCHLGSDLEIIWEPACKL